VPAAENTSKRALEPIDRVSEILFGLIMVLTFTGSLSVAESGRAEVRVMLIGAIGCNLAWGIIDAIMYLMGCLAERGAIHRTVLAVRRASTRRQAHDAIAANLPAIVTQALSETELDKIRNAIDDMPELPKRPRLTAQDWRGAVAVFLLVFLSTVPVALPFLFSGDPFIALRLSNAVAIAMLAALGWQFGRLSGHSPGLAAAAFVILGALLVAMTIALGG
jgi:VIT family